MIDDVVAALAAEQDDLDDLIASLGADGLATPSRCPGWSIADVLVHLAQTNELAAASADGELGAGLASTPDIGAMADVDAWAGEAVDAQRPADPIEARDRWRSSAAAQVAAFEQCDPSARVMWVSGELAARSLATTRLAETWIHSNDVAVGLGFAPRGTERLWHVARLAHRTLPYAFSRGGHEPVGDVAFVLESPEGEEWVFGESGSATVIRGAALELCEVAGRRAEAADTSLRGDGPDAAPALELVRTFA